LSLFVVNYQSYLNRYSPNSRAIQNAAEITATMVAADFFPDAAAQV